jgi:hypothetical protein
MTSFFDDNNATNETEVDETATVNPLIARMKAQMKKQNIDSVEDLETDAPVQSDSRIGLLGDKARSALKQQLADNGSDEVLVMTLDKDDTIPHVNDGKVFSSKMTKLAKLSPKNKDFATKRPDISDTGLLPGAQNRKGGIYKMTFEDGCFLIGYDNDLYGKVGAVVSRINRGIIQRYPRGTQIIGYEVLSYDRADLPQIKADYKDNPQMFVRLARIKKAKKTTSGVISAYKAKRDNIDDPNVKTNPLIAAHRKAKEAEKKNPDAGLSAMERLRKGGAKVQMVSAKQVIEDSVEFDAEAFDAAFDDIVEPKITRTIHVPQSNCNVCWDETTGKWITQKL